MDQIFTLCSCGSIQESILKLFIAVAKTMTNVAPIVAVAIKMIILIVTVEVQLTIAQASRLTEQMMAKCEVHALLRCRFGTQQNRNLVKFR